MSEARGWSREAQQHRESSSRQTRWNSEARFFGGIAERLRTRITPLDPLVLQRYREPRRPWFNKEFRFQLLGKLEGRRVLDIGCGDGTNSVLLAKLGARVTGIDLSSDLIEVCNRRAMLDGVEKSTRFICSPLELVELPPASFDVIWGDGILHHVIPELEGVLRKLLQWARPGALFVFSEPVCLSSTLRRLRRHVPIHVNATPDERPLGAAELELMGQVLPGLRMQWFLLLGRLGRFAAAGQELEHAPEVHRRMLSGLYLLDRLLLSLPGFRFLSGMCVMYGTAS